MRIKVKVTKEILLKSRDCGYISGMRQVIRTPNYTNTCLIANAVREILPEVKVIYVGDGKVASKAAIKLHLEDTVIWIPLPDVAFRAMQMFDIAIAHDSIDDDPRSHRDKIEPFEFDIHVPDQVINGIGIGQVYKILSESKSLELVRTYEAI